MLYFNSKQLGVKFPLKKKFYYLRTWAQEYWVVIDIMCSDFISFAEIATNFQVSGRRRLMVIRSRISLSIGTPIV